MSLITDITEREQLTYSVAGLRKHAADIAYAMGLLCMEKKLDPEEEIKAVKEWICKFFEEEFRSCLCMAADYYEYEGKEPASLWDLARVEPKPKEDTKINVYENMWNTLKQSLEADKHGWASNFEFLGKMHQTERLQKGIPEEDDEEEEYEE